MKFPFFKKNLAYLPQNRKVNPCQAPPLRYKLPWTPSLHMFLPDPLPFLAIAVVLASNCLVGWRPYTHVQGASGGGSSATRPNYLNYYEKILFNLFVVVVIKLIIIEL